MYRLLQNFVCLPIGAIALAIGLLVVVGSLPRLAPEKPSEPLALLDLHGSGAGPAVIGWNNGTASMRYGTVGDSGIVRGHRAAVTRVAALGDGSIVTVDADGIVRRSLGERLRWIHDLGSESYLSKAVTGLWTSALLPTGEMANSASRYIGDFWLASLEGLLPRTGPARQYPNVALVLVTSDTLAQLGADQKSVTSAMLASLVSLIDRSGARAIGINDLYFGGADQDGEKALIKAIRSSKAPVVIAAANRRNLSADQYDAQQRLIGSSGASPGRVDFVMDSSKIVRHVDGSSYSDIPKSFASALVRPGAAPDSEPWRIDWLAPPRDGNDTFFQVPAHLLVDAEGRPRPVAAALAANFKDRYVIIGNDHALVQRVRAPAGVHSSRPVFGDNVSWTHVQAQAVAQLIDGRVAAYGSIDPPWVVWAVIAVLAAAFVWFNGLQIGLFGLGVLALAWAGATAAAFAISWPSLAAGPLLAALASGIVLGWTLKHARTWSIALR